MCGYVSGAQCRLRIAVKDLYRVKGLKTSLNLSYYDISDEATSSAAVVDSLVRDGMWVDFPTAFNPLGDGYQSPAGSSSRSAAAVASYPWLDCTLGSDTSGSGWRPAMVNGVWQFRPSRDLVNLSGMIITYSRFDTPCVFARELDILGRFVRSWVPAKQPYCSATQSYELICLKEYLPVDNSDQMALINGFVEDMLTHLPAIRTKISIRDAWKSTHPLGLSESVDEYLRDVIAHTYYYSFYHSTDTFRDKYAAANNGRPPYVIPFVRRRWDKGAAVTPTQHKEAAKKIGNLW
ncbi:amidase signature domain-containing protein [Xylariaceae sp. AK1471]|nr:amidase signature domain-containing protein [Xylariaceae sp. AK1471]